MIETIFKDKKRYFDGLVKTRFNTQNACILKLRQIYQKLGQEQTPIETGPKTSTLS
jgi:hypothetical protein